MAFDWTEPGAGLASASWASAPGFSVRDYVERLYTRWQRARALRAQAARAPVFGATPTGLAALMGGGGSPFATAFASAAGGFEATTLDDILAYARRRDPGVRSYADLLGQAPSLLSAGLDYALRDAERRRARRGTGFVHGVVAPAVLGAVAGLGAPAVLAGAVGGVPGAFRGNFASVPIGAGIGFARGFARGVLAPRRIGPNAG